MNSGNKPLVFQSPDDETFSTRQGFLSRIVSSIRSLLGWPAFGDKRVAQSEADPMVSVFTTAVTTLVPSVSSRPLSPSNSLLSPNIESCTQSKGDVTRLSSSTSIQWQQIDQQSLDTLLTTREGFEMATKLKGSDASSIVDLLDKILDSGSLPALQERRHLALQRKLCGNCGILPTSCQITEGLENVSNIPIAGGGFLDVLEGRLKGRKVAIKVLRMHTVEEPLKLKKRFCKEAVIWKRLSHPNVLQFIGIANLSSQLSLISPWMGNGNIIDYLKKNREANRLLLLRDVTEGLSYLHSKDIVHGDLKGANIPINDDNQACLADFVVTTIISDMTPSHTMNVFGGGTLRWMAPELLIPNNFGLEKCVPSKESDIYAFGMVIYEVMTRSIPFGHLRQTEVVSKVIAGVRPERPTDPEITGLLDTVWPIAEKCWSQDRNERPAVSQVWNF